jgi:hypothetical protein
MLFTNLLKEMFEGKTYCEDSIEACFGREASVCVILVLRKYFYMFLFFR